MNRILRVVVVFGVALVALFGGFYLQRSDPGPRNIPIKSPAPEGFMNVALLDLEGKKARLSDWHGKVLVVNFWATWCAPCREEMPTLIKAQTRLGARGVQVIGVALDEAARVGPFSAEIGVNYPILVAGIDGLEMVRVAGNEAGALPFTVFVDRAGKIIKSELGMVTEKSLDKTLEVVL